MTDSLLVPFAHNGALLLAIALLFEVGLGRFALRRSVSAQLAFGLAAGLLAVAVMASPVALEPGIALDTRSVLLSVTGLFLGPIAVTLAAAAAALFRFLQGGVGTATGIAIIFVSAAMGVVARSHLRRPLEEVRALQLFALGLAVHLAMLALLLTLPGGAGPRVLAVVALPVLVVHPAATALLGLLMANRLRRERTVAALQESETRYRSLFENEHTVMLVVDPVDGRIVDANPAASHYYGFAREELRTMHVAQINTLDPEEIRAEMERARRQERKAFHFHHRLADGSVREVEVFSGPIRYRERQLLYSIVHDVTDRIRAEQSLHSLTQDLERAQRVAHLGSWTWDVATNRVSWSREMKRIFGVDPDDCGGDLGEVIARAIHPDDRAAVERANRLVAEEGRAEPLEYRVVQPDGPERVVRAEAGELERDRDGRPTLLHGIVLDITDRKQVEKDLREARERYEHLLRLAPVAVAVHAEGRILFTNPAGALLLGAASPEQVIGRPLSQIVHPDHLAAAESRVRGLLSGETTDYGAETVYLRFDGTPVEVEVMAAPLRFDGRPAVQVVATDISARKRAEREQKAILESLEASRRALLSVVEDQKLAEERVRELNAELEERVRRRTEELERANGALDSFSYSVSHDLRAPLRAIHGYSRILIDDHGPSLDPEGKRLLGAVSAAASRMGTLIDDLLRFSRLTRQPLTLARTDMTAMVRRTWEEVLGAEPEGRAELRLGTLPEALADAALIGQVWFNLLHNAAKYSRHRERPEITVRGTIDAGEAIYEISDNGAGFDMAYANKLFGVFQRLHSAAEFEGTGVGLALVKRIVERHDGRVWATGTPDHGATFSFALPLASGTTDAAAGAIAPR